MSSELFDIVFSGKCDTGVKPGDAQRGLAALFKLSPEKVSHLFSGERITIKKNIDLATAMKYKKAMQKAGCLAVIAEVGVQKKQTLSERLGQTLSEPKAAIETKSVTAEKINTEPKNVESDSNGLSLAPVRGAIMSEQEHEKLRPADAIVNALDTDLKPIGEHLLFDAEKATFEVVSSVTALDAELKPSGEALLFDNEKIIFEALEIDFDFDAVLLSEGSDILTESEKKPDVVVDIDVSHFELAELSENVNFTRAETLKKVEIDTSHLSLE